MIVVGFSGVSNNGKTTLISNLCNTLIPDFNVAVIKHDPKNKANIDNGNKDSAKFYNTGANIALISPNQTTIRYHHKVGMAKTIEILNENQKCDYIFIEGFKDINMLRICTILNEVDINLINKANAIAIKNNKHTLLKSYNIHGDILNLDDAQSILNWINKNGNSKNWNNNSL